MSFKLRSDTLEPENGDYTAFLKDIEKDGSRVPAPSGALRTPSRPAASDAAVRNQPATEPIPTAPSPAAAPSDAYTRAVRRAGRAGVSSTVLVNRITITMGWILALTGALSIALAVSEIVPYAHYYLADVFLLAGLDAVAFAIAKEDVIILFPIGMILLFCGLVLGLSSRSRLAKLRSRRE